MDYLAQISFFIIYLVGLWYMVKTCSTGLVRIGKRFYTAKTGTRSRDAKLRTLCRVGNGMVSLQKDLEFLDSLAKESYVFYCLPKLAQVSERLPAGQKEDLIGFLSRLYPKDSFFDYVLDKRNRIIPTVDKVSERLADLRDEKLESFNNLSEKEMTEVIITKKEAELLGSVGRAKDAVVGFYSRYIPRRCSAGRINRFARKKWRELAKLGVSYHEE